MKEELKKEGEAVPQSQDLLLELIEVIPKTGLGLGDLVHVFTGVAMHLAQRLGLSPRVFESSWVSATKIAATLPSPIADVTKEAARIPSHGDSKRLQGPASELFHLVLANSCSDLRRFSCVLLIATRLMEEMGGDREHVKDQLRSVAEKHLKRNDEN